MKRGLREVRTIFDIERPGEKEGEKGGHGAEKGEGRVPKLMRITERGLGHDLVKGTGFELMREHLGGGCVLS